MPRGPAKNTMPQEALAREIAPLLGVAMSRLPQLAKEGIIPKSVKGRYPVKEAILGYWRWKTKSVEQRSQSTSADKLRERREQEIAMKMAREERALIPLVEALADSEDMAGAYLESISGLPARITRNPRDRQRIEAICDEERLRLSDRFTKSAKTLRAGGATSEADAEDDT